MNTSRTLVQRRILINATANWLGFATQAVVAFFMVPALVRGLGDRPYGIWSLVDSILSYLNLFDVGIAASVLRYVAKFHETEDHDSLNRVFSTSLCIFATAGCCVLLIALGLALPWARPLGVPADLATDTRWLLVLLGINVGIGLPLGTFAAVLDGLARYPAKTVVRTMAFLLRS